MAVKHIGSTAIPGIKAKPIIDIAAGTLNAPNKNLLSKRLAKLGYEFRSLVSRNGHHLFYAKGATENRTHYLHISKFNSKRWVDDLKFIDILKHNKKLVKDYENLKLVLASQFPTNREKYTKNKDKFIKNILSK